MKEIDDNHLIDIFKETSIKLSEDRCGNLIFTQKKSDKLIIREPEAMHALTLVLSKRNIDLAIEPNGKQINVELKTQSRGIEKDFKKMLKENVIGCAFLHVLKNSHRNTLPELLKWFLLFIFTKEKKKCCWKVFDDITKISHVEFNLNEFQNAEAM